MMDISSISSGCNAPKSPNRTKVNDFTFTEQRSSSAGLHSEQQQRSPNHHQQTQYHQQNLHQQQQHLQQHQHHHQPQHQYSHPPYHPRYPIRTYSKSSTVSTGSPCSSTGSGNGVFYEQRSPLYYSNRPNNDSSSNSNENVITGLRSPKSPRKFVYDAISPKFDKSKNFIF